MTGGNVRAGATTPCPECGATIEVDTRAVRWCVDCEWNLGPGGERSAPERRLARRNEAAVERLLARGDRGARLRGGPQAIAAVMLGVAPLLLTVVCLGGGLALAVLGRHSPLQVGLGVILAVVSVAVFPRPPRLDPRTVVVDPAAAPRFWELLGDVARAVGTSTPNVVTLDLEPNASVGNVGLRSRTVLTIGTPLWATVEGQERVGLLAHELGHLAHGDPRRSRVVALGVQTLHRWWVTLVPVPSTRPDGPSRWAENLMLAVVRWVVEGWIAAIDRLQSAAVQRAELRSDRVAASVAGWSGYTRLLQRLRYRERLGYAVALAVARRDGVDFHTSVVDSLRSLPPREEERLRRLAAREPYDRTLTHPPARIRVRAVESLQDAAGVVVPDAGRWAQVDAELSPMMAALVERARADHDAKRDRFSGPREPRSRRVPAPTAG